jgi:drug/metabolite transporter (DMT)-like permease
MDNKFLPLLGSEIALSLYPQLIKLIPTTIEIQVAIRCITYSTLALIGYYITKNDNIIKTSSNIIINTTTVSLTSCIVMGIVNIIHIMSSYICFNALSSGVGFSIFYIYPIFNLLGRTLIYNEKINMMNYIYIFIAILGVYLIYKHKNDKETIPETIPETKQKLETFTNINDILNTKNKTIGILAGITSALMESIIYFMVKTNPVSVSPFIQLLKTYLLGGILSIIYLIQSINTSTNTSTSTFLDLDYNYLITLILFNAIAGFVGYLLRFIMIPRLSTLLFNSLIFTGVIFSYIWGYLLSNEPINASNISGTLLILLSIFLINKK